MPKPSIKKLQAQVDKWNARYSVGQSVEVTKDSGEIVKTATRSEAYVMSGHSAVIFLDGILGFYDLDRVKATAAKEPPNA